MPHKLNDSSLFVQDGNGCRSDGQRAEARKKLLLSLLPDLVFPFKMCLSLVNVPLLCSRKFNMGIKPFSLMENSISWQFFETLIGIPIFMWNGNPIFCLVLKPLIYLSLRASS